jgi:hypothetical protein
MRALRVLGAALVVLALAAPAARADEWNKLTYLTFSGPVQIPGVTLPAGTYMFKLADSPSNRHIVQVFNKDGSKIFATILAIPDNRLNPSDKPVVMFRETPAGTPAAVRAWFYPGNTIGDEFAYPRSQAIKIAKATHESVLAASSEDLKTAEVSRVDERTPDTASTATTTEQSSASAPPSSASAAQSTTAGTTGTSGTASRGSRRTRLPQTASPLVLYEILSGLSFAGAFGMRRLRRSR